MLISDRLQLELLSSQIKLKLFVKKAAIEAFEGQYSENELLLKIEPEKIKDRALLLIQE